MATLTDELREFLVRTPFFAGLWDRGLDEVGGMLAEREFPAGAWVFREGEPGRSMYVIQSGEVVCVQAGESGNQVELMRLGPGDFFGEMTLIEMQPRSFSVRVELAARLFELTNLDLYELYRRDVKAYLLVLQNINRELCRRLRRAGTRIAEFADAAGKRVTTTTPRQPLAPVKRAVLIVDDSPTIRSAAKLYLRDLPIEVVEAEDGKAALDLCRSRPIAVVIADVNMPGMDGLVFTSELRHDPRREVASIPVLLLSGDRSEDLRARGRTAGANDFVEKPVKGPALAAAVLALLQK